MTTFPDLRCRADRVRRFVAAAVLAGAAWGSGCAKKNAPGPAAPADASMAAESERDFSMGGMAHDAGGELDADWDLEDYERELSRIEDAMAEQGIAVVPRLQATANRASAGEDAGRCGRICELAETICGLETNICTMASDHAGEARYAAACTRVQSDCAQAREACSACENP